MLFFEDWSLFDAIIISIYSQDSSIYKYMITPESHQLINFSRKGTEVRKVYTL